MVYLNLEKRRRRGLLLPSPLWEETAQIEDILTVVTLFYTQLPRARRTVRRYLEKSVPSEVALPQDFPFREELRAAGVAELQCDALFHCRFPAVVRKAARDFGLRGKRAAIWAQNPDEAYAFARRVVGEASFMAFCCPYSCKALCDSLTYYYGIATAEGGMGCAVRCEMQWGLDSHITLPPSEKAPALAVLRGKSLRATGAPSMARINTGDFFAKSAAGYPFPAALQDSLRAALLLRAGRLAESETEIRSLFYHEGGAAQ